MKDHKWHLSLRKCGAMENCNGVRVSDFDLDVRVVPSNTCNKYTKYVTDTPAQLPPNILTNLPADTSELEFNFVVYAIALTTKDNDAIRSAETNLLEAIKRAEDELMQQSAEIYQLQTQLQNDWEFLLMKYVHPVFQTQIGSYHYRKTPRTGPRGKIISTTSNGVYPTEEGLEVPQEILEAYLEYKSQSDENPRRNKSCLKLLKLLVEAEKGELAVTSQSFRYVVVFHEEKEPRSVVMGYKLLETVTEPNGMGITIYHTPSIEYSVTYVIEPGMTLGFIHSAVDVPNGIGVICAGAMSLNRPDDSIHDHVRKLLHRNYE